jgi:hypothetical protein
VIRRWPEPPEMLPPAGSRDAWWRLRNLAEPIYEEARRGHRRRSPKWIAYRHRWKVVRDLARRHTDGDLKDTRCASTTPSSLRDAIAVVVAVPGLVLLAPAAALALAGLAIVSLAAKIREDSQ